MFKNKMKVRFEDIIKSQSGYNVLPLTNEIINEITPFIEKAIINYNAGLIWTGRVNEFGNHMEGVLGKTDSFKFSKPTKANGKNKLLDILI